MSTSTRPCSATSTAPSTARSPRSTSRTRPPPARSCACARTACWPRRRSPRTPRRRSPCSCPSLQTEVRLTRGEFETMIRPSVASTIASLQRALESADISAEQVDTVLLVGGSSRIPLVSQMVSGELGRPDVGRRAPQARHRPRRGVARRAAGPRRRSGRAGTGAHVGVPDVRGALPDAGAPRRSAHAARRHPRRRQRAPGVDAGRGRARRGIGHQLRDDPDRRGPATLLHRRLLHGVAHGDARPAARWTAGHRGLPRRGRGHRGDERRDRVRAHRRDAHRRHVHRPDRPAPHLHRADAHRARPSGPRPDRGDRRRPQPGPPDPGRSEPGWAGWSGRHRRSRGTAAVAGRPVRRRRVVVRRVAPPDPPDHRRGRARGRPRGRRHLRLPLAVGGGPPPARTDPVGGRGPDPAADVRAAGAGERARAPAGRAAPAGRVRPAARGRPGARAAPVAPVAAAREGRTTSGGTWRPPEPGHSTDGTTDGGTTDGGTTDGGTTCCDPTPAPSGG